MPNRNQTFTAFLTLLVLLGGYVLYVQSVGRFTGLAQLEAEYMPPKSETPIANIVTSAVRESEIAAIRGFGKDAEESNAPLILESRKKGSEDLVAGRGLGLYVYAIDYEIMKDNPKQIRLHPFSLVYISPDKDGDPDKDQINTVRGDEAILEFDRPVELTKVSGVKPISGWVKGQVELKTNRRTTDAGDDIVMFTDELHYSEVKNLIWADDWIRIVEKEATVTGIGMELELYPAPEPNDPNPKHRRSEAKTARLFKNVRFDLVSDGGDGFLGPNPARSEEGDESKGVEETSSITVTARGPFEYDLESSRAKFQKTVQVLRKNPPRPPENRETIDQLDCDELVLQFREKGSPQPQPEPVAAGDDKAKSNRNLQLMTTTATGPNIIVLSDSQRLQATGNYLFYDSTTKQTVLRGEWEMIAIHDNTEIHARSLVIEQGEDPQGEGSSQGIRNLIADGPNGWLEILDENRGSKKDSRLRIHWQGRLSMKGKPGSDTQLVTITKNVELDDDQGSLKCDELKVWLKSVVVSSGGEPAPGQEPAPEQPPLQFANGVEGGNSPLKAGMANRRPGGEKRKLQPIKVEASGNVSSHNDELAVITEHLNMDIIYKTPAPPGTNPQEGTQAGGAGKPVNQAANQAGDKPGSDQPAGAAAPNGPQGDNNAVAKASHDNLVPNTKLPKEEEQQQKDPLDVRAKRVAVVVEREGSRTKPIRAWAEGDVTVTHTPRKAGEDPVEIRGQTLQFERKEQGDIMKVGGSAQRAALIKSSDMTLCGNNEIYMNEITNRVDIAGPGYLTRLSDNDLTGKSTSEPKMLRVEWRESMHFNGKLANFEGKVKAQQGTAEIHCQNMDVSFDNRIDFREARLKRQSRSKQQHRIETVDCDKDVIVYDGLKENGIFVRHSTLSARDLHFDNLFHKTVATGPGAVQVIERKKPKPNAQGQMVPPAHPYELTQVGFQGQMQGDETNETAKFFDQIRILHTPMDSLDAKIDLDNLQSGAMTVQSTDSAVMAVLQSESGEKYRDFQAEGNVKVHAREYWGQCDRLSYDQRKDLLVFEGTSSRKSQFYRQARVGQRPEEFGARTIKYWRTNGKISTVGSDGFHQIDVAPQQQKK